MRWVIYNILFAVGYALILPKFLVRMWRRGGYRRNFSQRFARYSPDIVQRLGDGKKNVWIHAVSVGEIAVAFRYREELRPRMPGVRFIVTTTTSTAYALAEKRIGDGDLLLYFPCDFPGVVRRALDTLKPAALLLTESELWPNLIRTAHARGIPVILINGRISDGSYRGYRLLRAFFKPVLQVMDLLLVQTGEDRDRLSALGADSGKIRVTGTAKYDVALSGTGGGGDVWAALKPYGMTAGDLVLVGGSTWPGEETVLLKVLASLRKEFPSLKMVLVPRHAERRHEVEKELQAAGVRYARRADTSRTGGEPPVDVLLVDTTGELRMFYESASAIFVGKSLKEHGGQNIIEPAFLGKPVVVGPFMENFAEVTRDFLQAQAMIQVRDGEELQAAIRRFLADPALRKEYGDRARALVVEKTGSVRRSVEAMDGVLEAWRHP